MILKDQRKIGALIAGVFTCFSALTVISVILQGIEAFNIRLDVVGRLDALQVATFLMFVIFGLIFVVLGAMTTVNFARGTTITLDKIFESVHIQRVGFFRMRHTTHSIYGISHVDIEHNDDVRAFGLWLVLRSGERIPLAALSAHDHEYAQDLVRQIHYFLRG